jgi:hypothetical protein
MRCHITHHYCRIDYVRDKRQGQWDFDEGSTTITATLVASISLPSRQIPIGMVEAEDETNMISSDHVVDSHSTKTKTKTEQDLDRCLELLQEHSIRLVVFDMDQTAVAAHSRGRLERSEPAFSTFLNSATADFVRLIPRLFAQGGVNMAIATHSDTAEYGVVDQQVVPETHILGEELARALVDHHFPAEMSSFIFIVAYNPRHRGAEGLLEDNRIKRHHMRVLTNHFQIQDPADILFFDDVQHVVEDCRETCGVRAVLVDPEVGFQLSDLIHHLSATSSST